MYECANFNRSSEHHCELQRLVAVRGAETRRTISCVPARCTSAFTVMRHISFHVSARF